MAVIRGRTLPEDQSRALEILAAEYNRVCVKGVRLIPGEAFSFASTPTPELIWRGLYTEDIMRKRTQIQKEAINTSLNLAPPFPAPPKRPAEHTIRSWRIKEGKDPADPDIHMTSSHGFGATYSAYHFLTRAINDRKYKWLDDNTIQIKDQVITSPTLDIILEHNLTAKEKEWELPEPYTTYADLIAQKIKPSATLNPLTKKPFGTNIEADIEFERKYMSGKKVEGAVTKRLPQRNTKVGYVALAQVCKDVGVDPHDARAFMRKKKMKPEQGWQWLPADVPAITSLLKKEFKK